MFAPLDGGVAEVAFYLGHGRLLDERSDGYVGVQAVPHFQLADGVGKTLHERVVDPRLHQHAVGAHAGLACVAELRVNSALNGGVDVGVVEDDERRVPTQFEGKPFHSARTLGHQQLAYFCRAGEGEHPDGLVTGEHGAHRHRVTVDDVEDPRREPGPRPSSAKAKPDKGASLAGLSTTAQPAARAGATLRAIIRAGKFQGVMAATTPTGWRSTKRRRPLRLLGITSPYPRRASSA